MEDSDLERQLDPALFDHLIFAGLSVSSTQ